MITIISAWYNEDFLARLFLNHYSFADQIIIILDESTNDGTPDILRKYQESSLYRPFVLIRILRMPKGMDDTLKQAQINKQYSNINNGWVIIADADEFIHIPDGGMSHFLNQVSADVVKVDYFQMYQHKSESVLDKVTPIFEQRRHGKRNGHERWKKPAIARGGKNLFWAVGHHEIIGACNQYHDTMLKGAHIYMADYKLAVERRIKGRKDRMSIENHHARLSAHNFGITEQQIYAECDLNSNCKQVF
jgi:hypothetical protein